MRDFKNSADPKAWAYWANTHETYCPHGKDYFLAWHRGFIYSFENQLRTISGDPDLVLPYWNYYDSPTVPAEFLDPSLPLYRPDRTGTDVTKGLTLDAFASTIIRFQRGKPDAFEPVIEALPHNRVHNLIGGAMGSIKISPKDPLFWVHHANIDRLWVAWLAAGGGRKEPLETNTYWSGTFTYGTAVPAFPRVWTASTTSYLGYQYDNQTLPTALPPSPTKRTAITSQSAALPVRPATVQTAPLGVSRPLVLDERSVSVDVPLSAQDASRVRSIMLDADSAAAASAKSSPVRVVLDGVQLTGLGEKGGYYYDVYLNLPAGGAAGAPPTTYLLGSVGAFEIGVAQMNASMQGNGMQHMPGMTMNAAPAHGVRLIFPATEALRRIWPAKLDRLSVSFVRVDGARNPAKGEVVRVKAFRVEADPVM
jgi:tyrosinase